jgi:anti-sigma factor RsiW
MKTEGADTRENACHKHVVLLGAFLDGVLDAASTLELDEHLAHCEACRERVELDRAVRGSLKKAVKTVTASDGMRERVLAAMVAAKLAAKQAAEVDDATAAAAIQADADQVAAAAVVAHDTAESMRPSMNSASALPSGSDASESTTAENVAEVRTLRKEAKKLASWRTLVPLASAAALALVWNGVAQTAPQGARQTDVMRAGFGHDPLADLVAQHSGFSTVPPERTDPKELRGFERYVGVPVHAPRFRGQDARLVGGRVTTVHHERAAMLQYELGQGAQTQRVTVFIYDPRKIQIGHDHLTPRAIGTSEVRVGREDGYSVAVRAGGVDAGVGYTMVSDLDPERSAELAVFSDDD